jgi:hypothetical protein
MSAQGRGTTRNPQDFYPTPPDCVDSILRHIKLENVRSTREPCKGSGVIYDKLPRPCSYCEISQGLDYLTIGLDTTDLIVTNP